MSSEIISKKILLSIVIPVFNSEKILQKTVETIILELSKNRYSFEIILVNDGSHDNSWDIAKKLSQNSPNITAIDFIKNYGQHTAVFCGIEYAKGEYVVTMDDDMQNPPSEIVKLYKKIKEGYDLVFAVFEEKKHANYRKVGSKVIDVLNCKIFFKPKNIVLSNFRIFSFELAQRVKKYKTFQPYIPGLLLMHAGNIANVLTKHDKRETGSSNYNMIKILALVTRLLFNYSSYPLKFLSAIGILIASSAFLCGGAIIMKQIIYGSSVGGWTTLVVLIAFFNGFIILMLGVLGEYLIRLIHTVSHDKPYHINEVSK